MNAMMIPQRGDAVVGTYYGTPFSGRVTEKRWHEVTGDVMYYVALDGQMGLDLLGQPRTSILVKGGARQYGTALCVAEAR